MMKLADVKNQVYEVLTKYKDLVNSKKFVTLYNILHQNYVPDVTSAVTQLFLKNKINPLDSLTFVPADFLADADIKTIDLKNIQWIDSDAFYMSGLESITIPDTCTQIGANAFYMCFSLATVQFGPVENIGAHAFEATAIKDISIATPKISLKRAGFAGCRNLERVKIDSPKVIILSEAFRDCEKLQYFEFPKLSKEQVLKIDLPSAVNYPGQNLLVSCAEGQFSVKGE